MAKIGSVELERILEKICRKTRIIAEKSLPGKEIPYRESPSGRGLEWEIRGTLAAASEKELYDKEQILRALADGQSKIFEESDDPGMDAYDVLVSDVELSRLAGQLNRSSYTLRMLLKAIQYRRLAETYPSVAQQLLAVLNYCYKIAPQTLPGISQLLSYVLGMTVSAQTSPSVSQTATVYRKTNVGITSAGSTSYPTYTFGQDSGGSNVQYAANYINAFKFSLSDRAVVKKVGIYIYSSASGNIRLALYAADGTGGAPNTLLTQSSGTGMVNGWNEQDVTRVYITPGTYWLAWLHDTTSAYFTYNSSSNARYFRSHTYGSFPNPFGSGAWDNPSFTLRATYIRTRGYIKGMKIVPGWSGSAGILKFYFYAHASGNVRLAIYDNSLPKQKLWESSSIAVSSGWNSVNISAGTPTSLSLTGGSTYWLCWQTDSVNDVPSYVAGASGDGFYLAYDYGAYPSTISGETSSSEKWSMYIETDWF